MTKNENLNKFQLKRSSRKIVFKFHQEEKLNKGLHIFNDSSFQRDISFVSGGLNVALSTCTRVMSISVVIAKIILIISRQKKEQDRKLLTNEDELTFDCYRESLPAATEWIESAKTNTA